MSEVETLGILDEIEALVSDKLQVVSYKWLSRNFLLPSDTAKSVQACIPKDPATIRNAEFVQAEELYGQPATVGNCFRDNRFCGISNSFATRNVEGTSSTVAGPQLNGLMTRGPSSKSNVEIDVKAEAGTSTHLHQVSNPSSKSNVAIDVKAEGGASTHLHHFSRPSAEKGKVTCVPASKKGGQKNKNSGVAGGSLGNLWAHASAKSKDPKPIDGLARTSSPDTAANGEAQVCSSKAPQLCSDDEAEEVNFQRTSKHVTGRKRRVVFDFSDEENENEDAVSLASPGLPKSRPLMLSEEQLKEEKSNLDLDGAKEDSLKVKKGKSLDDEMHHEEISAPDTGREPEISTIKKVHEINSNAKTDDTAPPSPKRKKMLKTRIDERGREVTEVVWEGEDVGNDSKADTATTKKSDSETVVDNKKRPPAAKKPSSSTHAGPSNAASKAGNKKAGSKDPKQGNILSFFKRA
ncbi:hypothetical protein SAY87_004157 [Trapa incisa]|uniref:DNA polymerase delta subunit 3 n=1 Tax=Trapa incisa TaxID=236973 RepID=A0AAN7JNF4_9MYRT|nr:hypothetical protein SAY87_004157 [Trapa incisa]